ncbi:MAG TPA: 6-phosphofructokinase [Saprospiraceae bacterium]|nr:6-phosphofructokinase [Saprospiraceae bacterium]HMP23411.1 6-phosphofructokinase [Saprospiraceae bacterium]
MSRDIKRIAVFTSGGDAPGMNAAIRAVVRTASYNNLHVYGIQRGYEGMIDGNLKRLEPRDVGNIIHRGGTILRTARSQRFRTPEGRKSAYESLIAYDIDACVAIGGDGTFTGATIFSKEYDIPFIGIPGTIDNDLYGTDYTIGFDTAVNTAIEAVDKIRDTADSHNRLFFVEVMGRHAGFIALSTGIGSGAESVLIPETETSIDMLVETLKKGAKRQKLFSLVIVAEGNKMGNANDIAALVKERFDYYDSKVTIIGHLQRGGAPTAADRLLSSRLGFAAVEGLLQGQKNVMAGIINDRIQYTPLEETISKPKDLNEELLRLAEILAI